jgi:U6 snRNA-associated Sm-like protein LSm2
MIRFQGYMANCYVLQCSTKDMFIRGSVVRYVHLPSGAVDTALLEDATRREAEAAKNKAK